MDGLIYNIIKINIDKPTWVEWAKNTTLLVIHNIFQTLQTSETLNIYESLLLQKYQGKGTFKSRIND